MNGRKYKSRRTSVLEITLRLCKSVLEEIDSPKSLAVWLLIEYKEWDQVANGLPIEASDYLEPVSFARDYQAVKLLSKADFLPTTFDRRAVALSRFDSAEAQCFETNRRWRSWSGPIPSYLGEGILEAISASRSLIGQILGRFPSDRLLEHCRWGPGATTSISNPRTSVYDKYLEPITGSGLCLTLFGPLADQVTLWKAFQRPYRCVSDGNKVVLVPKNAKTERSIAMEPSFDSFIQLGIGGLMRKRLRRFGVDLNSQTHNQDLARYGSLTGEVATVDLSMASDTIAKSVVEALLPADWLLAMKCSRSAHWRMGGRTGVYSKFSSMGNGYTFELESVIFYAVTLTVSRMCGLLDEHVMAYGDDLTIGTAGYPMLCRVLSAMGFTVNTSKSFNDGVFRESCGKDYFLGTNVRPYFVRSLLRDQREFIKFHNGLLKTLTPFTRTAKKALRLVPSKDRIFGPSSLGDTTFYSPIPRGKFRLASKKWPQYEGFIVDHWVFKPEKEQFKFLEPAILASLSSNKEAPTRGFSTLRKRGTWKTRAVLIPSWDE